MDYVMGRHVPRILPRKERGENAPGKSTGHPKEEIVPAFLEGRWHEGVDTLHLFIQRKL